MHLSRANKYICAHKLITISRVVQCVNDITELVIPLICRVRVNPSQLLSLILNIITFRFTDTIDGNKHVSHRELVEFQLHLPGSQKHQKQITKPCGLMKREVDISYSMVRCKQNRSMSDRRVSPHGDVQRPLLL